MKYVLEFYPEAAKELNHRDPSVRAEVIKRINDRLENPHVSASALRGDLKNFYKIKLESRGLRIVYREEDEIITVFVVAVGKRDKKKVYAEASLRSIQKRRLL